MTAAKKGARAPAGIGTGVEQLPELLGVGDLASYLRVTPHFVYRLTREHRIRFVRVGKELRFRRSDVVAWLDAESIPPTSSHEEPPRPRRGRPRKRDQARVA